MFELARGLRAVSLLVAYDRFDSLLAEARSCYDQLFDDLPDDPPTQAEIVDGLAPLTPTAAARLRQAVGDTPRLADVAKQIDERVRDLWGKSDDIAAAIEKAAAADRTERAVELGCLLFNPSAGDYLWSHPLWVPRRVTELTPLQITDLIGEKRDEKNLL